MRITRRKALGTAVAAVVVLGVPVSLAGPAFADSASTKAVKPASSRHDVTKFVGSRVHVSLTDHYEGVLQGALSNDAELTRGVEATDDGLRFDGGVGTFDRKTGNFTESLHGRLSYTEEGPNGAAIKLSLSDFKLVKHGRTGEVVTHLSVKGATPAPVEESLTWATFKLPTVKFSHGELTVKNAPLTLSSEALQLFSQVGQPETQTHLGTTTFSIPLR